MQVRSSEQTDGKIWTTVTAPEARDLVIGIAAYGKRRKPTAKTTTISEIPQDAA